MRFCSFALRSASSAAFFLPNPAASSCSRNDMLMDRSRTGEWRELWNSSAARSIGPGPALRPLQLIGLFQLLERVFRLLRLGPVGERLRAENPQRLVRARESRALAGDVGAEARSDIERDAGISPPVAAGEQVQPPHFRNFRHVTILPTISRDLQRRAHAIGLPATCRA